MASRDTNAGDKTQVKAREDKVKLARLKEVQALHNLLGTYEGRWFMWRLLSESGIHSTSFVGEFPLTMAHREGKRAMGIWAELELFQSRPEAYTLMRREAEDREKELA